jgi:hypothetical protein
LNPDTSVGVSFLTESGPAVNFTQPPLQWILWAVPIGAF